jgi:hypothetical protein
VGYKGEQHLYAVTSFYQKLGSCPGSASSCFLLRKPTVPESGVGFDFGGVQLKLETLTHTVFISSLNGGWFSQIIGVVLQVVVRTHLLLAAINKTYLL